MPTGPTTLSGASTTLLRLLHCHLLLEAKPIFFCLLNHMGLFFLFCLSCPREALKKMKDVYEKTPQMGDPTSLEPQITETLNNIERLKLEVQKYEVRADPGEGRGPWAWLSHCLVGGGCPSCFSSQPWVCMGDLRKPLGPEQADSGALPRDSPCGPSSQAWLAEAESRVLSNRGDSLGRHSRPPDPPSSAPPDSSSSNSGSQDNKER